MPLEGTIPYDPTCASFSRPLQPRDSRKAPSLRDHSQRRLSNVYVKLGIHTRAEAARKALSEGWISPWDVSRED
jgi:hypothetical protein